MAKRIKIPGRIESAEMGGVVTGAADILDDEKGKKQSVINEEVDTELGRLDTNKQDNLTFDAEPTENSENPVTSGGVYAANLLLSQAIEAILLLIPSAASALNQLADKAFVNSSISTDTATFRGTYNVVSDLGLAYNATHAQIEAALLTHVATADNNDYAFVQIPVSGTSQDIAVTERYKFNGTAWGYEYDLNNSGFTAAQWSAINSGITTLLVGKLSALPTNEALTLALAGKQDNLTFDNVPTEGSNNPVKSSGIYTRNNEIVAMINALDVAKQNVLTFDTTPTNGSTNPVTSNGVYLAIQLVQTAVVALDGRMGTAETKISTAEGNIVNLQAAYAALTQSDIVVVSGALPSSGQQQNIIYRQPDQDHTPPQFYSDYMWNGTAWVLMATYNNAIDDEPTAGSNNLVKSGGVHKSISVIPVEIDNYQEQQRLYVKNGETVCVDLVSVQSTCNVFVYPWNTGEPFVRLQVGTNYFTAPKDGYIALSNAPTSQPVGYLFKKDKYQDLRINPKYTQCNTITDNLYIDTQSKKIRINSGYILNLGIKDSLQYQAQEITYTYTSGDKYYIVFIDVNLTLHCVDYTYFANNTDQIGNVLLVLARFRIVNNVFILLSSNCNIVVDNQIFSIDGNSKGITDLSKIVGENTRNLVTYPLNITDFFVDTTVNKIFANQSVFSVIVPINSDNGNYIVCQKNANSRFQVAFLDSLTPQVGDSVISVHSFDRTSNRQVIPIPSNSVGILFWYYYDAEDSSVSEIDIRNSLCVMYSVIGNERQIVPYGYSEFQKGHNVINTNNLKGDIVENVFIDTSAQKLVDNNTCYTVLADISDVAIGQTIYVHRKYTGTFALATFATKPVVNDTNYERSIIGTKNSFLTKKDYSFEKQDGENYLAVWFYYNTNIGTPEENYKNIYVGTTPFSDTYDKYINSINRRTLDFNVYNDSPIDYSLFTSGQANERLYIAEYIYKVGFVKNIKTKVNSEQDSTVIALIIDSYNNVVLRKYEKVGHGEITIDVNEYIGVPFYLAIGGTNVMFSSQSIGSDNGSVLKYCSIGMTDYNCGDTVPVTFVISGGVTYVLCQQVVYASLKEEIYGKRNTNCRNRLFVAGDSITAGHDSYVVGNHWWEAVCRKYKMVPYPAARNGAGYSYYNGTNACKIAHNYDFTNIDVAVFAFGTNDYGMNIPIGTINDTYTYSEDSSQTFFACIKYVIETVKTKNPKCTLILSLPINRSDKGTFATRYGYGTQNTQGHTLLDYCDAIIQCCEYYCIHYIDNRRGSFDLYSLTSLLYDNLHPSILGYKLLGSDMIAKFGAIYQPFIEYNGENGYGQF